MRLAKHSFEEGTAQLASHAGTHSSFERRAKHARQITTVSRSGDLQCCMAGGAECWKGRSAALVERFEQRIMTVLGDRALAEWVGRQTDSQPGAGGVNWRAASLTSLSQQLVVTEGGTKRVMLSVRRPFVSPARLSSRSKSIG